jgi:hypothetical protein
MVEPLRKRRKDGTLYQRRPIVENELLDLDGVELSTLVARARTADQNTEHPLSSEALMHILRREVRKATADGGSAGPIDALTSILTGRCEKIVASKLVGYAERDREALAQDVMDRLVDAIVDGHDLGDYAEVNFNDWLMHRWLDASRKYWRNAKQSEQLGDEVEEVSDTEVPADDVEDRQTPFVKFELKEAREQSTLHPDIQSANFSSDDLYRITEMVKKADLPHHVLEAFIAYHYLEVPIESNDPKQHTLVKQFGKSEKTIRIWIKRAENAFTELRKVRDKYEKHEAS